jgi:hypothetical protein
LQRCAHSKKGGTATKPIPPNEIAIQNALKFFDLCQDFMPTRFNATCMGGVAMTWNDEDEKVFIEFYNKGDAWYIMSKSEDEDVVKKAEDYSVAINDIKTFFKEQL